MMKRWILLAGMILASSNVAAKSLEFDVHDKALRAVYQGNTLSTMKGMRADVGVLYNEDKYDIFHLGAHVSGNSVSKEGKLKGIFNISIGGRLVAAEPNDQSIIGLAIGARVRFSPVERFGITLMGYHAPDITTFGDGDGYTETEIKIDYQIIPQSFVYFGFRNIKAALENGPDITLEDKAHLGLKFLF